MPGVSDTLAAALWGVRTLFDLASVGVSGVDTISAPGRSYSAILTNKSALGDPVQAGAIYYGLRLFALATQNGGTLMSVQQSANSPLAAYAVRDRAGVLRVVLINFSATPLPASVNTCAAGTATVDLLTGPSLGATAGLTLSGQTYAGSPDGLPHGTLQRLKILSASGSCLVTVPANSAVLLTSPA